MKRNRYGAWDGGPDPLAPPYDVRAAVDAVGKDVLEGMFWIPLVTFWQVTADLPFATGVPAGHGHKYTSEYVDGFNAVMQLPGVTPQELTDLRKIIAAGK